MTATEVKPAPIAAREPARAPAAVSPAAEVAAEVGVAACDAHVAGYQRCIAALPAADRPAHAAALEAQRIAWVRARADAGLADALPGACAAATAAAKVSLPQCRAW